MEKRALGPRNYLGPTPASIVGALVNDRPNYLVVAYCNLVQHDPPMIGISLNKAHYTNAGIRKNGSFSVNIPSTPLAQIVDHCGIVSGRTQDKSQCLTTFYGTLGTAPLAAECPLNLECRLVQVIDFLGSNELFVGEVVETYADPALVTDEGFDVDALDPLLFAVMDSTYRKLGPRVGKAWEIGRCPKKP